MPLSRREFLAASLVASGFSRTTPVGIQFGYAAITWGDAIAQAIDDVSAVGFRGIQLRANAVTQFGGQRGALRDLLAQRRLALPVMSSGNLTIDPTRERDNQAMHVEHAKFVKDLGGTYLQVIDERPKRALGPDDYRRVGQLLTELGKRTADVGVPLVYHHHMNSVGERPEEIAKVLDAADRKHVGLLLDVAHYQQGGGDPVKAVRQYRDWLCVLHIKDVESPVPGATGDRSRSYRFVELGMGKVNLPAAWAAIEEVGFKGWAIVELDRVPDDRETPKEAAAICKRYLESRLGATV